MTLIQGTFDTAFYRMVRDALHLDVTLRRHDEAGWAELAERAAAHRVTHDPAVVGERVGQSLEGRPHRFGPRLGDQEPVERIAVMPREALAGTVFPPFTSS